MSSLAYATLLVSVYAVSKAKAENIAFILSESDKESIRTAIIGLESKRSGYRLPEIITRYYGIGCERVTLREIGETLDRPISPSYVHQLRAMAERYLCKSAILQPVAARLCEAGVVSQKLVTARDMLTPVKLEVLQAASLVSSSGAKAPSGHFLLDCLSDCEPDNPCPSCRAREILSNHGILDISIQLAQEWLSGPAGDWRSTSIKRVNFSVRTMNCLLNDKIYNLGQLCEKSESELMRTPYLGRRSLNEVKDFLKSVGKQLRS